jgi:NAD(P)-dependent dehydrogenase (short-subunit alcohol dehydrogenase family)
MKVIVIGGTGTIGSAVVNALRDHEVVTVGLSNGDFQADISDVDSLKSMYQAVGDFDAVVCAAGDARFKPLDELSDEDFLFSLEHKLMGQVHVVRVGSQFAKPGVSFTLTSGVLASEPAPGGVAVSIVNAGIEAFGRAAALELKDKQIRVNTVSPPWINETLQAMGMDTAGGLPAVTVAKAYVDAIDNKSINGQVIDARAYKQEMATTSAAVLR